MAHYEQNCTVKTTRDISTKRGGNGILSQLFGKHHSAIFDMTKPPLNRPYRSQPPIGDYEILTKTYIAQNDEICGIIGTAIIIHNARVLLVQRASTDDYPDLWEVPGGSADDDETIVQCTIRELQEETGLVACEVTSMIREYELAEEGQESQQRKWKVFMFLIKLDPDEHLEIKLDPDEHQAYLWATAAEVQEGVCGNTELEGMSDNQKNAILASFDLVNNTG